MFSIKEACLGDVEELVSFGAAQFTQTFGHLYKPEDLKKYLDEAYKVQIFTSWLQNNEFRIFISCDDSLKLRGYVLCGPCSLPLENCGFDQEYINSSREVKRLYIAPDAFGTGLSDALLTSAMHWLQSQGFGDRIFLGVYSENPRAIRFYQKHHFKQIGEYDFVVGDAIDKEFICHWEPL